ncbi:cytochrome b/b6 domain-containing protein [Hymenobacter sp. GOD-10R]|uniref:cytochrome b/b6 domain-containing protein n=1 Tax=Hymenobacter sp. GOD-10R TaxID=3093922 RepID=UPI002D7949B6|nr:cytochrome b/b6 domain-containing protein [Hymenobacter sp. GOD-10R]WRQ27706.1 cytochrome b/b6 domain-containing protein [Hymenobacter sp. GOD-10R]
MLQQAPPLAATQRKNSAALRFWHWTSALLILALLTTILFQFVIVKAREAAPLFQETLQKSNITLTTDQARSLTRIISHRIWDWHIYLGVGLSVMLLFRIITELRQPATQKFSYKLAQVRKLFREVGADSPDYRHSIFVKYSYLVFYIMLIVMVVTGLALIYADDVPFLHSLEHTIKEIHNFTMYLILSFTALHIIGVVRAELTTDRGIVSDMINGGDQPT